MIGFFLVFVSLVCAVCRGLMWRLQDVVYERRIGQTLYVETDDEEPRTLYFVQFFIRGAEYWGWVEVDEDTEDPLDQEWFEERFLHLEPDHRRPNKIDSARLVEQGWCCFEEDVTQLLRQLSGPGGNFYGEGRVFMSPGFLKAYLQVRAVSVPQPWDYCELRVVPGYMPPSAPLRIRFTQSTD